MKFLKASAWRNFHSLQLLGRSKQKVLLSRPFGNLGIGILASLSSLDSALHLIYFCLQKFFFLKIEYLCCLVLRYSISTTLPQILISLRIQSKASISVLEKVIWTFRSIRPLVFWKNNCSENFCTLCILSSETSRIEFFLSTLVHLPEIFPKSSLEQLLCR